MLSYAKGATLKKHPVYENWGKGTTKIIVLIVHFHPNRE